MHGADWLTVATNCAQRRAIILDRKKRRYLLSDICTIRKIGTDGI